MKTLPTKYEIRTNGIVYAEFTPCEDANPQEFEQHVIKEFTAYRSRRGQAAKLYSVDMTEMEVRHLAVCTECAEVKQFDGWNVPVCTVCNKPESMMTGSKLKPITSTDTSSTNGATGKADVAAEASTPNNTAAGNQPPALNAEPPTPSTNESFAAGKPTLSPEAAELIQTLLTMDGHNIHLGNARIKVRTVYGRKAMQEAIEFAKAHGRASVTPKEEPRQVEKALLNKDGDVVATLYYPMPIMQAEEVKEVKAVTIPQDAPVAAQSLDPDDDSTDDDDDEIPNASIANAKPLLKENLPVEKRRHGKNHIDYEEVSEGIKQGRKWQWRLHNKDKWITSNKYRQPVWGSQFRYRLEPEPAIERVEEHPDKAAMMPYLDRGARWEYRGGGRAKWKKSTLPKPSWYAGNRYRIAEGEIERLDAIAIATAEAEKARVIAVEDREKTAAQIQSAPRNTIYLCNNAVAVWAIIQRLGRLDMEVVSTSLYASEPDLLRVLDRGRPVRVDHLVSLSYPARDAIRRMSWKAEEQAIKQGAAESSGPVVEGRWLVYGNLGDGSIAHMVERGKDTAACGQSVNAAYAREADKGDVACHACRVALYIRRGGPPDGTKPDEVKPDQSDKDTLRQAYGAIYALFSVAGEDPEANDSVIAIYERARKATLQIERALTPFKY